MTPINRRKIATISLVLAMFFNPLGFDALFKLVMNLTGSYWITDLIFYLTSALFLGLYFFLINLNPVTHIKTKVKNYGKKF